MVCFKATISALKNPNANTIDIKEQKGVLYMPRDLRSFKNIKINDVKSQDGKKKIKKQVEDIKLNKKQKKQVEKLKENLVDYKDKSSDEIYNEVRKMAKENKEKGTLDNQKLNSFANSVAPMLNNDQKQRLNDILKQLKKI